MLSTYNPITINSLQRALNSPEPSVAIVTYNKERTAIIMQVVLCILGIADIGINRLLKKYPGSLKQDQFAHCSQQIINALQARHYYADKVTVHIDGLPEFRLEQTDVLDEIRLVIPGQSPQVAEINCSFEELIDKLALDAWQYGYATPASEKIIADVLMNPESHSEASVLKAEELLNHTSNYEFDHHRYAVPMSRRIEHVPLLRKQLQSIISHGSTCLFSPVGMQMRLSSVIAHTVSMRAAKWAMPIINTINTRWAFYYKPDQQKWATDFVEQYLISPNSDYVAAVDIEIKKFFKEKIIGKLVQKTSDVEKSIDAYIAFYELHYRGGQRLKHDVRVSMKELLGELRSF